MDSSKSGFVVLDSRIDDEDSLVEARKLVLRLRPQWTPQNVKEMFGSGNMNDVHCFHLEDDTEPNDALIVRIFRDKLGGLVDRNTEVMAFQLAASAGCCGRLEATFGNGIIYQYGRGKQLDLSQLCDPKIIDVSCRYLAALHCQNPSSSQLKNLAGQCAEFPSTCGYIDLTREVAMRESPDQLEDPEQDTIYQKHKVPTDRLENECRYLESLIEELGFDLCPGHGDFNRRNIIYDDLSESVTLIDYEFGGMYYEGFDLAYLFNNTPRLETFERQLYNGEPRDVIPEPARELWLRGYVTHKHRLLHGSDSKPSETSYRLLKLQVDVLELLVAFGSISRIQFVAGLPWFRMVPFVKALPQAKEEYFENKGKLMEIRQEYMALKDLLKE